MHQLHTDSSVCNANIQMKANSWWEDRWARGIWSPCQQGRKGALFRLCCEVLCVMGVTAVEASVHSGVWEEAGSSGRCPPSGLHGGHGGHGAAESDSPARLSGTDPVTQRLLLLLRCVTLDDGVPLTPWHGACLAKERSVCVCVCVWEWTSRSEWWLLTALKQQLLKGVQVVRFWPRLGSGMLEFRCHMAQFPAHSCSCVALSRIQSAWNWSVVWHWRSGGVVICFVKYIKKIGCVQKVLSL